MRSPGLPPEQRKWWYEGIFCGDIAIKKGYIPRSSINCALGRDILVLRENPRHSRQARNGYFLEVFCIGNQTAQAAEEENGLSPSRSIANTRQRIADVPESKAV